MGDADDSPISLLILALAFPLTALTEQDLGQLEDEKSPEISISRSNENMISQDVGKTYKRTVEVF